MDYRALTVSIENKIAHIVLNRPDELNTMNVDFWRELPHAMREVDEQASARVIILSSTGKHFTAGMDLGVFMNPKNISLHGDPDAALKICAAWFYSCRIPSMCWKPSVFRCWLLSRAAALVAVWI